tara:strand:+ start:92 stop:469 length:378 start_codon:yes stop_codon:yes gene_type:complete
VLDHVSLSVAELDRAGAFYDAALGALGYVRVWSAETALGYGVAGGGDKLALKTRGGGQPQTAAGFHLAFTARDAAGVDAFHAAALAAGGNDEGAPGWRPHYGEGYYAAFVSDPDGHRIEAVFHAS